MPKSLMSRVLTSDESVRIGGVLGGLRDKVQISGAITLEEDTTRNWTFSDGISDGQISVANLPTTFQQISNKCAFATEFRQISKRYGYVGNLSLIHVTYRQLSDAVPTPIFI
ncbi:hypothetical protein Tco_0757309, partial [Tanacetum coccineum]